MRQLAEETEEAGYYVNEAEELARITDAVDTDQAIDIIKTMGYSDKDIDTLIEKGRGAFEDVSSDPDMWGEDWGPGAHPGAGASSNDMDAWKSGVADYLQDTEMLEGHTVLEHSLEDWVDADLYDLGPDSTPRNPYVRHGADEAHRPHFTEEDWKLEGDMRDATESWMHSAEATPIPSRFDADGMPAESPNPFPEDVRNEYEEIMRMDAEVQEAAARHEAAQTPGVPESLKIQKAIDDQEKIGKPTPMGPVTAPGRVDKPLIMGPVGKPAKSFEDTFPDITRRGALIGAGITAVGVAGASAMSRAARRASQAVKSIVKPAEAAVQAPRVLSRAAQVASNNQAVGSIRRNLMNETIEELFHKVMRKGVKRGTKETHTSYTRYDRELADEGFEGDIDISSEEYWKAREWDDDDLAALSSSRATEDGWQEADGTGRSDAEWVKEVRWSGEGALDSFKDNLGPPRYAEAINDLESEQARDILLEMGYDESALAMAEEAGAQWASEVSIDGPEDWIDFYDAYARTPLDLFDLDGAHADAGPWAIHGRGDFMSLDDKFGMGDGSGTEMYRMDMYDPVSTPSNPHYDVDPADSKSFEEVGRPDAMFDDQGMPVRTREEVRKSLDLEPDEHAGMLEKAESAPEAKPDAPEGGLSRRDMLKGSGALAVTAATGGLSRGLSQVAGASTEIPITTVAKAAENVPVSAIRSLVDMGSRQLSERLSDMVYEGRWTDGSDESKEIIDELAMRGFDELEIDNHVAGLKMNRERAEESVGLAIDSGTPPNRFGDVLKPDPEKSPREDGYYYDEDHEGWEEAVQSDLMDWGSDYEASLEDGWEESLQVIEDMEYRGEWTGKGDARPGADPENAPTPDPNPYEDDLSYSPLYRRPRGGLMYPPPVSLGSYSAYLS
jgi:hypothetical protein